MVYKALLHLHLSFPGVSSWDSSSSPNFRLISSAPVLHLPQPFQGLSPPHLQLSLPFSHEDHSLDPVKSLLKWIILEIDPGHHT